MWARWLLIFGLAWPGVTAASAALIPMLTLEQLTDGQAYVLLIVSFGGAPFVITGLAVLQPARWPDLARGVIALILGVAATCASVYFAIHLYVIVAMNLGHI